MALLSTINAKKDGDLEIDYCGTDKVLYKTYDADEVDNM